jgi:hypothetical protein
MKKILIIFTLAFSHFFCAYGQEDKFDKLFDKYQEAEGVTTIKIAKPMFGMLSSLNIDDSQLAQIKPLLSKINGLKVLITENPENKNSAEGKKVQNNLSQLSQDISSYLSNLNYSEIMSVNNSGSKIKFLSSEAKNGILDDLLLSIKGDSGENILVKLDGKLSMDDINNIINSSETNTNPITNTRSSLVSENTSSYLNGETRNVGEFSGIQVSNGINVVFKQESPTSVKVIADADKLQYVVTKVENGTLRIFIDSKGVKNLKFKNLSVNVSAPEIKTLQMSSAATFNVVNAIRENELMIDASSGSSIKGKFNISNRFLVAVSSGATMDADIDSKEFSYKGTSGSSVNFEGQADTGMFDVSSGAVCKAKNFKTETVYVQSTSGGDVSVSVSKELRAKASSGGSIRYKGNPGTITSDISKISGGSLKSVN